MADPQSAVVTRRQHAVRVLAAMAGVLVLITSAGVWYWRSLGWESTDNAQIDGHVYPVSARVTGQIVRVMVDDNEYVQAGTVLAQLDPLDYDIALAKARADLDNDTAGAAASRANVPITSTATATQLASAEAEVENAMAGLVIAERHVDSARAAVAEARANDLKAADDVARYAPLAQKDEVPQRQYTQAIDAQRATAAAVDAAAASMSAFEHGVVQAQARLTQARAQLRAAATRPQQIAVTRSHAAAADAQVRRSAAAVEQAELNRRYTNIVAPVSGIVGQRSVQPGQNVVPGQQLLTLVPRDRDNIWVTANFKETQLKKVRPGQSVVIDVDAYGRSYRGKVLSIGGASGARYSLLPPENATGNYVKVVQRIPVKIILDQGQDDEHLLRVGMSVEPRVRVR